jgi:hypothetical protein
MKQLFVILMILSGLSDLATAEMVGNSYSEEGGHSAPINYRASRPRGRSRPRRHKHYHASGQHYRRQSVPKPCAPFIRSDESMGPWGKIVANAIFASQYKEQFMNDVGGESNGMAYYCPAFADSGQTDENKLRAWAAFWGIIAARESTCRPTLFQPKGTAGNPHAGYGLYTLIASPAIRSHQAECANIGSVAGQTACALRIMGDTQFRTRHHARARHHVGHGVRSAGSYWGPIRALSPAIRAQMLKFSFCRRR